MPSTATLSVLLLVLGASACRGGPGLEGDGELTVAFLGQALVEHDPRAYLDAPLASVRPLLADADLVFTNLEVAVAGEGCACVPTRDDVYFHGAGPEVVRFLDDIGVSLLSLANNHSWDYGAEGIVSTIAAVEERGMAHAGTGADVGRATAPGFVVVGGRRVALVAMATVNVPEAARATDGRPGVNLLAPGDSADRERNLEAIRSARAEADVVIVYHHHQVDTPPGWQGRWAREAVEAGADVYVSHGEPTLGGVELHRGGLILHGLGNFIFHTRTEVGRYPREVWESAVVSVTLEGRRVAAVRLTPLVLDEGTPGPRFLETRGLPSVAGGRAGRAILERIRALSEPHGADLDIGDGEATLRVSDRDG